MRVLAVTSSYPKYPGDGTAPFIESITQGIVGLGHEVDVVLPYHPELDRPDEDGLRFLTYRYAPGDRFPLWGYAQSLESDVRVRRSAYAVAPLAAAALRRRVSGLLRDGGYDLVHAHWVVPNAALIAGAVRSRGVPLVVSLHGSDVFLAERFGPARRLAGRAFRVAGAVTACSGDLHRRALALGADPATTRTVPYGVDAEAFAPGARPAGARSRLGVPEDGLLVVAVGRLVEKKGFEYLVEAAAGLDGARVVVAGDGDLRGELERRAAEAGADVAFPGALARDQVREALAAADVVVVPSVVDRAGNVDGLPNSLLEGLASGRPVVATRAGGIPDVVTDGENGLLVPERDAGALAEAIGRLVADPALRERLGREARRTAVEDLSWEATTRAVAECYEQALESAPRARAYT